MNNRISIHEYTNSGNAKINPLWWQEMSLSFTASGYGSRIPTRYMVRHNGKWRRVYCCIYGNIGTCYIGKSIREGIIVSF